MPKFFLKRWHGLHMHLGFAFVLLLAIVLAAYEWFLGLVAFIGAAALFWLGVRSERAFRREFRDYVLTLTHRIKKSSRDVVQELPIGIVLYNEQKEIEWHNPFAALMTGRDSLVGSRLEESFPPLANIREQGEEFDGEMGGQHYRFLVKADERLVFILNITEYVQLKKRYEEEKLSLGILMLDNLDEVTQDMDEQARSLLMAKVVSEITDWANKYQIFLRRLAADRFLLIMDQKTLKQVEQNRFDILDDVRDLTSEYKLPLTLSIGVSSGADSLTELGRLAQASLDVALGRGGDQAAVRNGQQLSFYGGRTNALEKRTRVRARVISHALRDLMRDSDKVIVMGHRMPDMDSLGACIGMLKAAQLANKDGYVVIEEEHPGIERLMEEMRKHERIHKWIVTPEQAMHIATARTLIVVVDTHRPSLLPEPRLLQISSRIMVIDHHRRGEELIRDATMMYMEPYASSTCELVTELLQYFHERASIEPFVATALLAGIAVDTKSFSLRTGARTFEAASYLRRCGADTAAVQDMLKEDLELFNQKAELIRSAVVLYGQIAVAVAEPGRKFSQLTIAKAADTLLNMSDIAASFVIAERKDGGVGISARSLGQINVQVIMEAFGGGGHFANAAAQWSGSLEEAAAKLRSILEKMHEEERLFE